jgi:aspartyl/glutamyl-tRNA(Asn/Gln) amidotransferase C subunit
MKVTEKDVVYVADLANLELSGEERAGMVRDLNSILDYIERLNELDRWRKCQIATASMNPSRAAKDLRMPVAKTYPKVCASPYPTKSRWRTRLMRMERFSECQR